MIIAIDGPAAAGKGTLAKKLSAHLDFAYMDTGLLYRAIGKLMLSAGEDPTQADAAKLKAKSLKFEDLAANGLRTEKVGQAASKLSAFESVRTELLVLQKNFADNPPNQKKGAILDGRDIGTVVCPKANVKLFVTASTEVRAHRRLKELQDRGTKAIYARVLSELVERDARDRDRSIAPLEPADDACIIDTSNLSESEVFKLALEIVVSKQV